MPLKLIRKAYNFSTGFGSFFSVKKIILALTALLILFLQGCAFFSPRHKPQLLFTDHDIENIIQDVKLQEGMVAGFYSTGTLTINGWILDSSVDIFFAGKKDPLMLKLEISHSWGKPLIYFLIKEDTLAVRDFTEKRQYTGRFSPEGLSRFLPNMDCSSDMIWAFLRGYPQFASHVHSYEGSPGVLILEDRNRDIIGKVTFSSDEGVIEAVSSPPRFLTMEFTDFRKTGEIDYAEKTVLKDIKGKRDLTLKRNKVIFNRDIPDAIFTLENQPAFEIIDLDKM
ncbi:MAG: hypothetical protein JXL81_05805 [Deltaproteobacteria bacterium]|nr:hypothetical protein [Deltaproteobacteria bacterium]